MKISRKEHVQCGFNYFDPYGHEGSGQDRPTISIWGMEGNMSLIRYDWAPSGVDLATINNEKTQRFVSDPGSYVWQEGASVVADCLVKNTEPRVNAMHALHVLEIIEAARESEKSGRQRSSICFQMAGHRRLISADLFN